MNKIMVEAGIGWGSVWVLENKGRGGEGSYQMANTEI